LGFGEKRGWGGVLRIISRTERKNAYKGSATGRSREKQRRGQASAIKKKEEENQGLGEYEKKEDRMGAQHWGAR